MICNECKEDRPPGGLGLCRKCYSRHWRKTRPDKRKLAAKRYRERNRAKINANAANWRERNPEKHREAVKRCIAKNPEKHRKYNREYNRKNKVKIRKNKLESDLTYYGISRAYYDLCLDKGCQICKKPFTKVPCLDHNHSTRKFRGIICTSCNKFLGHAFDNLNTLQRAINYLS